MTTNNNNNNDFSAIDDSLYAQFTSTEKSYSGIGYSARDGLFFINNDIEGVPHKSWEEGDNAWQTPQLALTVLAVRKRITIEAHDGALHHYPPFTPRKKTVDGKFSRHIQVMGMVAGYDEPFVLGLKGYAKTLCWDNPAKGKYHNNDFAVGVELGLNQHIADIAKQYHKKLPTFAFEITLKALQKPVVVGTGKNTSKARPFVLAGTPVFIGADKTKVNYEIYKANDIDAWLAEWDTASVSTVDGDEPDTPLGTIETDLSSIPGFDID